ncbi:MAG TPA: cell division protein ZapA [Paludibacter sp.]|nr:cell division protein ZapA [Paludibacter sp.]
MEDTFLIHVQIGGLRLPLRIPRKDEEIYRKAEKLLVKYLDEYQKMYNQRSYQDILILVSFRLAVILSKEELHQDIIPLAEKIEELDKELKHLLSKKKQ